MPEVEGVGVLDIKGGHRLGGAVRVSGAKNAILPMLAATVLTKGQCLINDAPFLKDVSVMSQILRGLGARVSHEGGPGGKTLWVDPSAIYNYEVGDLLTREMRSSIFLMGSLLGRLGRVRVAYPGGCDLGPRPIDLHLSGLRALGARLYERHGFIEAEAPRLSGADIHLDFPSVGATENIMMAAVLAQGTTTIKNAAKEPEIVDLQNFLNSLGARVMGAGTDVIRVEGVESLGGTEYWVIPDRIETGTFMVAAAITRGDLMLENVIPEHVESVSAKMREAGVTVEEMPGGIRVRGTRRPTALDLKTLPYPGFPTDMQPQFMALMSVAEGTSVVTETVFENRFKHAEELRRMGANVKVEGRAAVVKGVPHLSGAMVEATNLRSGAALVLAGLVAEGNTCVRGTCHIDRGYERLEEKLRCLGAVIDRKE
ncbi:MAG: UDP-N-acetylglucosamine 1-carboxyvinyltransferase [Bacillota bacterium]